MLNKDGDTLSTKELSAVFGFGNQKEAAVMERFLKIAIRKELHIEGDVNMTFEEFYELIGGDRESGLQGIALAFEVTFYRDIFEFEYFSEFRQRRRWKNYSKRTSRMVIPTRKAYSNRTAGRNVRM